MGAPRPLAAVEALAIDCCVAAKLPTKPHWRKYCIPSPPSQITPHRTHTSSPMTWVTRALPRNGHPPAIMGGCVRSGGLIVVSVAAKSPTKSPGRKYCISSPPSQITPHRTHPSSLMTWGTRALPWNGRPPAMGGCVCSGGLIVVWRQKHLQITSILHNP